MLFLGYGFSDLHLNKCFHSIRRSSIIRPVVIVDWASDTQDPMQFRGDEWSYSLCKTIPVNANEMATKQHKNAPPTIAQLKATREFEVSTNPKFPLAIWYGGFVNACENCQKIKMELG